MQASQPILEDSKTKGDGYKPLVNLFKIRGIGLEIVKYIHCKDKDGETALILSAQEGHLDCVKFLLQKGACIHARDNNGDTALILSAQEGHLDCVKFLLQQGANVTLKGQQNKTAL